ncbi:hypothetical protein WICPIJ_009926 [Wickerhamomyces pijperi]|uniref:Uncharacterized protein n=1 Tax=Wickerhamomyces pijperi TaxID=599730 RepID=A0A9P8TC36_WICPI|nr:hypothetical protein WICPIJ_009926 [Wickerhamomyces pijperi]
MAVNSPRGSFIVFLPLVSVWVMLWKLAISGMSNNGSVAMILPLLRLSCIWNNLDKVSVGIKGKSFSVLNEDSLFSWVNVLAMLREGLVRRPLTCGLMRENIIAGVLHLNSCWNSWKEIRTCDYGVLAC